MKLHPAILIVLAGAGACATNSTGVQQDQEFELAPGRTASVEGTGSAITFESVTGDSRCPGDVTCVWAGNAGAVLRVRSDGRDTTITLNTGLEPKHAVIAGVRFELVRVAPVPMSQTPIAAKDYRVVLIATDVP